MCVHIVMCFENNENMEASGNEDARQGIRKEFPVRDRSLDSNHGK